MTIGKPQIIFASIILIGAIGVIILIKVLFSGSGSNNSDLYKQIVAAKDTIIQKEHEKIDIYERLIEEKDRSLTILHEKDSASEAHSKEIELNYNKLNETLRHIPERINRIATNNDSLRLLLSNY